MILPSIFLTAPCLWQQAIWLLSSDSTRSRQETARGEIKRAHVATLRRRVETKNWQKFGYESHNWKWSVSQGMPIYSY